MLGYGCGAVGGLMVRGEPAEQERAIGRAIELGIDYFDTAPMYGDGASERNLGRVLRSLGHPDVRVGTKVLLGGAPPETVAQSLDASLGRLGLERVDLLQLHDPIGDAGPVLEEIAPALVSLKASGKVGHVGFTAIGDTPQLREVLAAGVLETAQVPYNLAQPERRRGAAARTIRRRTTTGSSTWPRRPAPARSASACWPAVRCAARRTATRSRPSRSSRSAPAPTTRPTSAAPPGSTRSSERATPRASWRPACDSPPAIRRSAPCWWARRASSSSSSRWPPSSAGRSSPPRWSAWPSCARASPGEPR